MKRLSIECTATTAPHLYKPGKRYMVLESFGVAGGHACHHITNEAGCADIICPNLDTTTTWRVAINEKTKTRRSIAA